MSTAIDASAMVAIMVEEPDCELRVEAVLNAEPPLLLSPVSLFEIATAFARIKRCSLAAATSETERFVSELGCEVAPITAAHAAAALSAFERFGKGRHPAALNMGDCFSFALASESRSPLIAKGADFAHPDGRAALPALP